MTRPSASNPPPVLRDGLHTAWPICLGYLPIGIAFGVLAQKAGLTAGEIGLMSLMVFAGGSQFIAVAMLQTGAPAAPIIATTFMVNLRHFLMSSSLSLHLKGSSWRFLALFAYGVTDESFAVNMGRFRDGGWDRWRALVVNHAANLVWVVCCVAGTWAGQFIPAGALGIDYALTAMFICLLVFQLRSRLHTLTALLAGLLSTALYVILPGTVNVVTAAIAAATAGFWLRRHGRRGERRVDAES